MIEMKQQAINNSSKALFVLVLAASMTCGAAEPFRIAKDAMPEIVIQEGMRPFVAKAVEDVAGDLEKIFGVRPKVATAGEYGRVECVEESAGRPRPAIVLAKGGSGWENYSLESVAGNVLKITGSDDRGVMFGLYRFASECLGVDPFYFWSGLEPAKSVAKEWKSIDIKQGDPSFKFRGWFINDEDFLNGFRPKENGKRKIAYPRYHVVFGPSLADRICEAAARAGFNMMVCASYVDILNPDEKRLVDITSARGLWVTMHHQEPVGAGALQLDLHFPEIKGTSYASHPDLWRKAWKHYIDEWAKVPDVVWQLGLRGRRDAPFWQGVEDNGWTKSGEETDRRRASFISRAIEEQLALITVSLGRRPEHTAVQLWHEGAELYQRGFLDVPAGTTVVFADNSAGFKFQGDLGGVESLDPKKKSGLYYHLALVHGNHRCELVPPLRTHQILGDAWRKGAREFVLFNVSNVRPFLYTIEAAGEMTRDIGAFDAERFRDRWAAARFGKNAGAVARAIDLYFAAYETEYSRDALSSYGSPRERAPLAILHDGMVVKGLQRQIKRFASRRRNAPKPVASQYVVDPDALVAVGDSMMDRTRQDQMSSLADKRRYRIRAIAQAAAFNECVEQVERASKGLDEAQKRQLFERLGYPAKFMALSSGAFSEMSCALAAMDLADDECALRHAKAALALLEERDRLDGRYNTGKWKHWYDRDLLYPCKSTTAKLREALNGNGQKGS